MNKHGFDKFTISELDVADSNDEACEKEAWFIFILSSKDPKHGYNMTHGGDGGDTGTRHNVHPYAWWVKKHGKEKADEILHTAREMARKANRAAKIGSKLSERTRKRISDTLIRKGIRPPITILSGKDHPMFGKTHSAEAIAKMSKARTGRTYESIMGEAMAAKLKAAQSESWKGSSNPRYKNVDKDALLLAILSEKRIEDAAKVLGISHHKIISSCIEYFGKNPSELKQEHHKN